VGSEMCIRDRANAECERVAGIAAGHAAKVDALTAEIAALEKRADKLRPAVERAERIAAAATA